jgi:murein DD-endopeptidase MepM/ murein hydrolase activator NlpD
MRAKNSYRLPLNKKAVIGWSKKLSGSHRGKLKHALDFSVPVGTPVYAALGGLVVYIKQDSRVGGPSRKFQLQGNRIVLKHKNNEYTAYEHLKYKGAHVKVGERVRKAQLIGYSGNTGNSLWPHLHFEVFTNPEPDESEGETLQVVFPELKRTQP